MTDTHDGAAPSLTPLQHWMRLATVEEQEQVALLAGTSREYLYHLARPDGYRRASADMAGRIEQAIDTVNAASPRRDVLPRVPRPALCSACEVCSYALTALGDEALRLKFDTEDASIPRRARHEKKVEGEQEDGA